MDEILSASEGLHEITKTVISEYKAMLAMEESFSSLRKRVMLNSISQEDLDSEISLLQETNFSFLAKKSKAILNNRTQEILKLSKLNAITHPSNSKQENVQKSPIARSKRKRRDTDSNVVKAQPRSKRRTTVKTEVTSSSKATLSLMNELKNAKSETAKNTAKVLTKKAASPRKSLEQIRNEAKEQAEARLKKRLSTLQTKDK
eukprot:snap_masked-scaffold_5-processed-gene-20.83-mRNA-1 protein AED:1.00 eAED:1.00 QI:0/-1/0/0/-1/1/1/0/202